MQQPRREQYRYQPRYCEENIWHLCQAPAFRQCSEVLVIAARGAYFPIFCQRAASSSKPAFWDYHVILLWQADTTAARGDYILDFDTRLPFCTPALEYFTRSFADPDGLPPAWAPCFRLIPAPDYIAGLRSDRRHMRTADGWLARPPPWPPISTMESNLSRFTDMDDPAFGTVLNQAELHARLTHSARACPAVWPIPV